MIDPGLAERLKAIRLVAMDVDGTYSNGLIYYDENGQVSKAFHTHDGFAFELLKLLGIRRGFLTGRTDACTRFRAKNLGADFIIENILDKTAALNSLLEKYALSREECLYIGDDIADISAFEAAGVKVAVANAVEAVKTRADLVTVHAGGDGAIREVTELIVAARGLDPVELWFTRSR